MSSRADAPGGRGRARGPDRRGRAGPEGPTRRFRHRDDVKTSPDLRHARVYVSVLGNDDEREATLDGLRSAHGFLQRRLARELRMKHTPTLEFVYDDTADRADAGSSRSSTRGRGGVSDAETHRHDARRGLAELRDGERFVLVTHENPDGDALGSLVAMQRRAARARQGLADVHRARRVPAALRVRASSTSTGSSPTCPPTSRSARSSSWTAATSTATPVDDRRRARSSTSTTTTTTRASATSTTSSPEASCTAEIVWDLMRGARRRARRATIAEALYVGLVTDTGRFMYENTGAARRTSMAAELIDAGVDVARRSTAACTRACRAQARAARRARWRACSASTAAA